MENTVLETQVEKTFEKKERKSRKGTSRTFSIETTSQVNPIIETINTLINSTETSDEVLKMLRLELRKSVRSARAVLKARKNLN